MRFANLEEFDCPPEQFRIDPYDFNEKDLRQLISLIRNNSNETEIDSLLKNKLSLLAFTSHFFRTGHHGAWIIPQARIKLPDYRGGRGLIPDYLFAGENSDGITWWVMDLKSPKDLLYKQGKNGRIVETESLLNGINQIRDYVDYCTKHQAFIRDVLGLKSFTSPFGILLIGRESELKKDRRKQNRKAQFNRDTYNIQIRTFDSFLRRIAEQARLSQELSWLGNLSTSLFTTEELSPFDREGTI